MSSASFPRIVVLAKRKMSLIYTLNKIGRSIDPCGSPAIMSFHRRKVLFTLLLCKRWFK